jgi:hypothetical protein
MRREGVSKHLDPVLSDVSNQPFWVGIPQEFGGEKRAVALPTAVLKDICWGFIDAERAGELHPSQRHIAERCREIVQALSLMAVDALVDEITGYQRECRERELQTQLLGYFVQPAGSEGVGQAAVLQTGQNIEADVDGEPNGRKLSRFRLSSRLGSSRRRWRG